MQLTFYFPVKAKFKKKRTREGEREGGGAWGGGERTKEAATQEDKGEQLDKDHQKIAASRKFGSLVITLYTSKEI